MSQITRMAEVVTRKLVLMQLPADHINIQGHCGKCQHGHRVAWDMYYHLVSHMLPPQAIQGNIQIQCTHKQLRDQEISGNARYEVAIWTAYEHTVRIFSDDLNDYILNAGVRIIFRKDPHTEECATVMIEVDSPIRKRADPNIHQLNRQGLILLAMFMKEATGPGFTVIDDKTTNLITDTRIRSVLGKVHVPGLDLGYNRRSSFLHCRDDIIDDRTPEVLSPWPTSATMDVDPHH